MSGQSYQSSFWMRGEGLTSVHPIYGYIYWYDKDQKYPIREAVADLPLKQAQFDWTLGEVNITVPTDAHYGSVTIGTYATTGVLTLEVFSARISVPPALANAKSNQP